MILLNVPFGLVTEYDNPWVGGAQALKFDIKTYNINPSLAWRINDIREQALEAGRDPKSIETHLYHNININEDREEALAESKRIAREAYPTDVSGYLSRALCRGLAGPETAEPGRLQLQGPKRPDPTVCPAVPLPRHRPHPHYCCNAA